MLSFFIALLLWTHLVSAPSFGETESYFAAVAAHDVPLPEPKPGEWRYEHPEPGQNFEQYQLAHFYQPDTASHPIYLKIIGRLSPLQQQAVAATQQYLAAFYQRPVVFLKAAPVVSLPPSVRRRREGYEQFLASVLLDAYLRGQRPAAGLAFMGICPQDICPRNDWNYVFGLALYPEQVGITSLYRLPGKQLNAASYTSFLNRLISLSSHEIGHMFRLRHCTYARCVMNGTNGLDETDATPNRLCSQCQRKLHWYFRFDNRKRLRLLAAFFTAHELKRDYRLARQDLRALK